MDLNFENLKKEAAATADEIVNKATVVANTTKTATDDLLGDLSASSDISSGAQDDNAHTEHYFANEQKNLDFSEIDPQAFVQRMSAGAKEAQEELKSKFATQINNAEEIVDDFLMFGNKQQDLNAKQAIGNLTNDFMNVERGLGAYGGGDAITGTTDAAAARTEIPAEVKPAVEKKEIKEPATTGAAVPAPAIPAVATTSAPLMPLKDVPHDLLEDDLLGFEQQPSTTTNTAASNKLDADFAPSAPTKSNVYDDEIAAAVAPKPAAVAEFKDSDTESPSISYTPSPAKKLPINEQDNEKFISSEDLLSDFKDEPQTRNATSTSEPKTVGGVAASNIPTTDLDADDDYVELATPVVAPPTKPAPAAPAPAPTPAPAPVKVQPQPVKPAAKPKHDEQQPKIVSVEEIFYKYGLDAWFKPERLHPQVESLIYWRDIKKSGIVFGAGLVTLLAISCFSVISVFAYLSLLTLLGTVAFRIYKSVTQAIQKTGDGHPFKEYLDLDLTISQEKVQNIAGVAVAHVNGFVAELRRLFLVEDLVDSIKFGVILWVFTYIGAWFNGMTLVILAFVSLFTLPKVYENNKQSIDTYLDLVRSKLTEITEKIKTNLPIGNKKPIAAESDKDK